MAKNQRVRKIGGSGLDTPLHHREGASRKPVVAKIRGNGPRTPTKKLGKVMFGDVAMYRVWCGRCQDVCLSEQPDRCDAGHTLETPREFWRESLGSYERKKPSVRRQREILIEQDGRCFWCVRSFGAQVMYDGRALVLSVEWDHFIPFAYTGACDGTAFVAACQVCNGIKGPKMYETAEQCRVAIIEELERRKVYEITNL